MTSLPITITAEGGGYVVTCACQWLRFVSMHERATQVRDDHAKKCKSCQAVES